MKNLTNLLAKRARSAKKSLLLGLMLIAACFVFTACDYGATVNTNFTLNADLSGSRTMVAAISESAFDEYFSGSYQDLANLVTAYCPAGLNYTYDEACLTYTFSIDFDSIEEYELLLMSILDEDDSPVEINAPSSVWSSGVYINEYFDSEDLLQWLADAMVDEGFVDSSNSSYIFDFDEITVIYDGVEYENAYSTIHSVYVNEITTVSLNYIDVLTEALDTDSVSRSFIYHIPTESMELKGTEICAYMNSITPSYASIIIENTDDETIITIYADELSLAELEDFDIALFGDATVETATLETSPFIVGVGIEETFSATEYVSNYDSLCMFFYAKEADNICIGDYFSDTYFYKLSEEYDESDEYKGYYCIDSSFGRETLYTGMSILRGFNIASVDISSNPSDKGETWNRTIEITLGEIPSDEACTTILEKLESRVSAYEEIVSFSTKSKSDNYIITIEQTGSISDVNDSTCALVQNKYCEVVYEQESQFLKQAFYLDEYLDMSNLIPSTILDDEFVMSYTCKLGTGLKLESSYAYDAYYYDDSDAVTTSGSSLTYTTNENGIFLMAYGTFWKTSTIIILVAVLLLFMLIGVAVVLIIVLIVKKSQKPADAVESTPVAEAIPEAAPVPEVEPVAEPAAEAVAEPEPVAEAEPVAEPEPEAEPTPVSAPECICPACGNDYAFGSRFCTSCGFKLEQ